MLNMTLYFQHYCSFLFSSSLRSLTVLDSQPRHEQLRNIKTREINLDAGADLLYR